MDAHPDQHVAGYAGLMQTDAYAGFNRLYETRRKPGPIIGGGVLFRRGRGNLFRIAV